MALVGKIRRMYLRDKMSFSEIARRTGLARNTIKKWLHSRPFKGRPKIPSQNSIGTGGQYSIGADSGTTGDMR